MRISFLVSRFRRPVYPRHSIFNMAELEISVVGKNLRAKIAEGPHWDTNTQKLFWVDCFDYSVHVLDVDTGEVKEICAVPDFIQGFRAHNLF